MENARALNERLRNIIREVSNQTGGEIKRDLVSEFNDLLTKHSEMQTRKLLLALHNAVKKM